MEWKKVFHTLCVRSWVGMGLMEEEGRKEGKERAYPITNLNPPSLCIIAFA